MEEIQKLFTDLSTEQYETICQDGCVAIDTETTGLDFKKDNLCTIQLCSQNFMAIILYDVNNTYTNLSLLLSNENIKKIFHNAVFDISFLMKNLKLKKAKNIICTKISSKLVNGLNHNNSLKPLLKEYLDIQISKEYQQSDWSVKQLSQEQVKYAINDVLYLERLWNVFEKKLEETEQIEIAYKIFEFIPTFVLLQIRNIDNIFVY